MPTLLWADLTNRNVWILVLSTLAFGAIGFADDYLKVVKKRNLGLSARHKLRGQIAVGLVAGQRLYCSRQVEPTQYSTRVMLPFFKTLMPDVSAFYILFAVLVLVGAAATP